LPIAWRDACRPASSGGGAGEAGEPERGDGGVMTCWKAACTCCGTAAGAWRAYLTRLPAAAKTPVDKLSPEFVHGICPRAFTCRHTPRKRRGRRHSPAGLLAVGVVAVIAGSRSFAAVGEWAADAGADVPAALGADRGRRQGRPRREGHGREGPAPGRRPGARHRRSPQAGRGGREAERDSRRPGTAEGIRRPGRRRHHDRRPAHPARHRPGHPCPEGGLRHDRQGQHAHPVPAAQEAALGPGPCRLVREHGPRPPRPPHHQGGAGADLDRVRRRRTGRAGPPHRHEKRGRRPSRSSTSSPATARPARPRWPPGPAATGTSKTSSTGSATSPTRKTSP
jgi:hypothetical protein